MNYERNERATNRSVFADVEPTNLRRERANFTVQTMPWLAVLAIFVLRYTDSDRRSNFWRIANRILLPLCKSNANCCTFREKTSWKLSRAFIDREDGSFFFSFLLSSSFFVRNEFQARRVSTNYLTEVTRYESSLKWIVLFVPLPMLMIRDSSLFPLLLNCPLDSFDNFFVAYVYNEESWIAKCIHVYYMYSWEYFCFCIGRRYYSDSRTLK